MMHDEIPPLPIERIILFVLCWQSARSMVSKRHYRDSSQTSSSNSFCRLRRCPALVVSLETILESYRLSNQDNLRSSRQVNVRLKQQYITETRPRYRYYGPLLPTLKDGRLFSYRAFPISPLVTLNRTLENYIYNYIF